MAQNMRADPLGRNSRVGGHAPHDLEQANAADMRLAAWEKPQRSGRHLLEPFLHGGSGPGRDRHQPLLIALAANHQEWLSEANRAAGKAHKLTRPEPRPVE